MFPKKNNMTIPEKIEYVIKSNTVHHSFHPKDEQELKVNISKDEVDKLIKEYKKIKKRAKSNFGQIKKLGLVDKHGRSLNEKSFS